MVCEKCRGQHPTDKCRKSDKIIIDFLELNDATKKASKEVQLDKEPPEVLESDEDEYQFVNQVVNSVAKVKPSKATNLASPYDLWKDLA